MTEPSEIQLLHGREEAPSERRLLRAGPVTAELDGIDLRYIRLGSLELVRRVYVATRDESWGTLESVVSNRALSESDDGFQFDFDVENADGTIDFRWHGTIVGKSDGTFRYEMAGLAQKDFKYNRVGICVLHPPHENAGRPYRAETPDGPISGHLPDVICPQLFEGGVLWPIFPPFTSLAIQLESGGELRIDFEGDLFEMEDQRNWTDASFKTYSTPLSLGVPHQAEPGQQISQAIEVTLAGVSPGSEMLRGENIKLSLGESLGKPLPSLGLGIASHGEPLTGHEVRALKRLRIDHLRVDLHLADAEFENELERAKAECEELGCALEIGLFLTEEHGEELLELATLLGSGPEVERILVFKEGARPHAPDETTPSALVELARDLLLTGAPGALFAGGSDMYFCQLNRTRPNIAVMDAVYWSVNPQVHAFDDVDLMETLEAQGETVTSARRFSGDLPLCVGPVTFRPRWNPYATEPARAVAADELPPQVDPRQMSLLGAAWTLGSVKYLAEAGADSLTYFETTGWRGVMEREIGSPLPHLFPSTAGQPFPLYYVLADLSELKEHELVACRSDRPLGAVGLALRETDASDTTVLVANMTPEAQTVVVDDSIEMALGPYAVKRTLVA